jgi:hypothetical protein
LWLSVIMAVGPIALIIVCPMLDDR